MSRVLIPNASLWYEQLKAVGYYREAELERAILQHVSSLFPDFYVFPFKIDVVSNATGETSRPDLAMVMRDFSAWGIIEVELSEHDINHVLKQTRCFLEGNYNAREVSKYMRNQMHMHCSKKVSLLRLTKLVDSKIPSVLVMADTVVDAWEKKLEEAGVDLCVFEIFKSTRGDHVYRTFGDYPIVPTREAHCRRHARLANVLEIVGDFEFKKILKIKKSKEVEVEFNANMTRWAIFQSEGKSYLRFLGAINPLPPNTTFALLADKAHKYYFKIN